MYTLGTSRVRVRYGSEFNKCLVSLVLVVGDGGRLLHELVHNCLQLAGIMTVTPLDLCPSRCCFSSCTVEAPGLTGHCGLAPLATGHSGLAPLATGHCGLAPLATGHYGLAPLLVGPACHW